jgi:hypothetical protein
MFYDFNDNVILTNDKTSANCAGRHLLPECRDKLQAKGFCLKTNAFVTQTPRADIGELPVPKLPLADSNDAKLPRPRKVAETAVVNIAHIGFLPVPKAVLSAEPESKGAGKNTVYDNVGSLPAPLKC